MKESVAPKIICTTTINAPTPAIERYDTIKGWHLIVTGDRKTPEYPLKNGTFVSWEEQQKKYPDLCKLVGSDSVARGRMVAFIEAHKRGASVVASIDDDCYPYDNWGQSFVNAESVDTMAYEWEVSDVAFNPLAQWNAAHWHRGFPIELIGQEQKRGALVKIRPLIQQNLCDGQSDFDAVFRLANGNAEAEYPSNMLAYTSSAFCPLNTQNTIISGECLKDHFANIPFIGRADDIWAGYIFQALHPDSVIYFRPTSKHNQQRTRESIVQDFKNELFAYQNTHDFLQSLKNDGPETAMKKYLPKKSQEAIEIYRSYFA